MQHLSVQNVFLHRNSCQAKSRMPLDPINLTTRPHAKPHIVFTPASWQLARVIRSIITGGCLHHYRAGDVQEDMDAMKIPFSLSFIYNMEKQTQRGP